PFWEQVLNSHFGNCINLKPPRPRARPSFCPRPSCASGPLRLIQAIASPASPATPAPTRAKIETPHPSQSQPRWPHTQTAAVLRAAACGRQRTGGACPPCGFYWKHSVGIIDRGFEWSSDQDDAFYLLSKWSRDQRDALDNRYQDGFSTLR